MFAMYNNLPGFFCIVFRRNKRKKPLIVAKECIETKRDLEFLKKVWISDEIRKYKLSYAFQFHQRHNWFATLTLAGLTVMIPVLFLNNCFKCQIDIKAFWYFVKIYNTKIYY